MLSQQHEPMLTDRRREACETYRYIVSESGSQGTQAEAAAAAVFAFGSAFLSTGSWFRGVTAEAMKGCKSAVSSATLPGLDEARLVASCGGARGAQI